MLSDDDLNAIRIGINKYMDEVLKKHHIIYAVVAVDGDYFGCACQQKFYRNEFNAHISNMLHIDMEKWKSAVS